MSIELIGLADRQTPTKPVRPRTAPARPQEIVTMLLHEELTRARIQDLEDEVHDQRIRRSATLARRWHRVSRWAERQARRHEG